jgi:lipoprotein-anchoring transpeptidase ErfK/SrfK
MVTPDDDFAHEVSPTGNDASLAPHEADDLYLDGVAAAIAGKRAAAERLLRAALALEPGRAKAWLWLAGVVDNPQQSIQYLERVLEMAPDTPHVQEGLAWARQRASMVTPDVATVAAAAQPDASTPPTAQQRPWSSMAVRVAATAGLIACAGTLYAALGPASGYVRHGASELNRLVKAQPSLTAQAALRRTATSSWGEQALADHAAIALSTIIMPSATPAPTQVATKTPQLLAVRVTVVFHANNATAPTAAPTAAPTQAQITPTSAPKVAQVAPTSAPRQAQIAPTAAAPAAAATPAPAAADPTAVTWNALDFRAPWYPQTHPLTAVTVPQWFLVPTTAAPTATGKVIDVDLSEQMVRAYEDGKLFMQSRVSTGLKGTPTVKGTYRIYEKYRSVGMSGPGYMLPNVPYAMFFFDGYSLHGTYWHKNFGQPMSHGCVNMKTEDAKRLFDWVEPKLPRGGSTVKASSKTPGTLVVVHE